MAAYYNEFDPFAANWLRELIKDGLIADGVVDERSITDVSPSDLKGFKQCHFFAGIGGWSMALKLASWPDDRPVWTGSPPCQPFSVAGKQTGKDDERHLWPIFFDLIKEQEPATVFGEQVASAIRHGWFDDLQADMEKQNYATAMAVLPACSVGAPHKRERMFFVANSIYQGSQRGVYRRADEEREAINRYPRCDGTAIGLADSEHDGCDRQKVNQAESSCDKQNVGLSDGGHSSSERESEGGSTFWDGATETYCRDGKYRPIPTERSLFPLADGVPNRMGILRGAGNAIVPQVAAEVIKAFMFSEDES